MPLASALNGRSDVQGAAATAARLNARMASNMPAQRRPHVQPATQAASEAPIQRVVYGTMPGMWAGVAPADNAAQINAPIAAEPELAQIEHDVAAQLPQMEFNYQNGAQPVASIAPDPVTHRYDITHGYRAELGAPYNDLTRFAGAILHEMMHVTAALQYDTNVPGTGGIGHMANMNLPAPDSAGALDAEFDMRDNQFDALPLGAMAQFATMTANWNNLNQEATQEQTSGALTATQAAVVHHRLGYAQVVPGAFAHYDTVLTDLLYYLQAEGLGATRTYAYARRMLAEANARRNAALGAVQAIAPAPLPPPPAQGFWEWLVGWVLQFDG